MRLAHTTLASLAGFLLLTTHLPQAYAQASTRPAQKILASIDVNGISIEDLVNILREQDPTLQIVVERDPGEEANNPDIHMRLKNVTAMDVLKVMTVAYPGLQLVSAQESPILVLKIQPGYYALNSPMTQVVRVYSLNSAVRALKEAGGSSTDKALADALSLIQAALAQTPQNPPPVIQVHAATLALIVKANSAAQETVVAAIGAMTESNKRPPIATEPSVAGHP